MAGIFKGVMGLGSQEFVVDFVKSDVVIESRDMTYFDLATFLVTNAKNIEKVEIILKSD